MRHPYRLPVAALLLAILFAKILMSPPRVKYPRATSVMTRILPGVETGMMSP